MTVENSTASLNRSPEKNEDEDEDEDESPVLLRRAARLAKSRSSREERETGSEKAENPRELFKKPLAEIKTASKEDVPEEDEVSDSERPVAVRALAEEEAEAIPEHEAEDEITEEVAADVAAKEFLEEVGESGDIEAAAAHTLAKIEASAEDVIAAEGAITAETPPEASMAGEGAEAEPGMPEEEVLFDRSAETGPVESEETDEPESGEAGTGKLPPQGPPPPEVMAGAGGPGGPEHPEQPFGPGFRAPGAEPIPSLSGNLYHAPITTESPDIERYDQGNPAVTALIGGIIGYMIGRRRGRIKTEKRLLPIQKKLEKQVENLHWEIKRKELSIRNVAAQKVRNDGALVIEKVVADRQAARAEKRGSQPEQAISERRIAPEASLLHGPAKAHEHIGHMLVTAEAASVKRQTKPEKVPSKEVSKLYEKVPDHLRQRHVETLSRADLLAISEKIIVDGTSLRHIYETHLIGERGLRRLVAEHLRGGDVKKILRREIVEHEIDFERDPVLRDLPAAPNSAASQVKASPNKTLEQLVNQASASLGGAHHSDELAYYKARAAYEAQEQEEQDSQRRIVDIGFGTVIAVLLAVIIILYVTRR